VSTRRHFLKAPKNSTKPDISGYSYLRVYSASPLKVRFYPQYDEVPQKLMEQVSLRT